jgi:hypothetical protein
MTALPHLLTGIIAGLLPAEPPVPPATRSAIEADVAVFVTRQILGMPAHLRVPYRIALWAFQWMALRQYGRPYTRLDAAKQRDYISVWIHSTVGFKRDFIKLIRSCALLRYYDHPRMQTFMDAWANPGAAAVEGGEA